MAAINTSTS